MGIYIRFQCCACKKKIEIHKYSFNINTKKKQQLCEHFKIIEYEIITHWGFFTLGWNIKIDLIVYCECGEKFDYGQTTCNKESYTVDKYHECCNSFFAFTVGGYDYKESKALYWQKETEEAIIKKQQEISKALEKQEEEYKKLKNNETINTEYMQEEVEKLNKVTEKNIEKELFIDFTEMLKEKSNITYVKK